LRTRANARHALKPPPALLRCVLEDADVAVAAALARCAPRARYMA
jgi:hypothetical protein